MAHRTQKHALYVYQFIIKDTTQKQPNGRNAHSKRLGVWGGQHRRASQHSLGAPTTFLAPACIHQPGSLLNLTAEEFLQRSMSSFTLLPTRGQWVELKIQTSNPLVFLVTNSILRYLGTPPKVPVLA